MIASRLLYIRSTRAQLNMETAGPLLGLCIRRRLPNETRKRSFSHTEIIGVVLSSGPS
jgi:hypothetical protein